MWDIRVGIVMGYRVDVQSLIPVRGKKKISIESRSALGPTEPHIQQTPGAVSSGIKWAGRESDHSPPSSPEIKNCGATSALAHISSWRST
jgi:hypothetical protein